MTRPVINTIGRSDMSDELERKLAERDIENANREIANLCAQIRKLEARIQEQEALRLAASRTLEA